MKTRKANSCSVRYPLQRYLNYLRHSYRHFPLVDRIHRTLFIHKISCFAPLCRSQLPHLVIVVFNARLLYLLALRFPLELHLICLRRLLVKFPFKLHTHTHTEYRCIGKLVECLFQLLADCDCGPHSDSNK